MYNVSVPIPDEVLFDAHLTKKLSETYVRKTKQKAHILNAPKRWMKTGKTAFYAIIEVDKSGIGCGKNEL